MNTIAPAGDRFVELYWQTFPSPEPRPHSTRSPGGDQTDFLEDRALLEKAFGARNGDKVRRLFDGDTSGHQDDDSAADLALLSELAFYTGPDGRAQLDRLFRLSALYREDKWERPSYREPTLSKALDRSEFYRPGARIFTMPGVSSPPPPAAIPPAPTYPTEIMPPVIGDYVTRAAASLGVPVEMVANPMLVTIGVAVGNRFVIMPKPGYEELPAIWHGTIAPPGSTKTAAQKMGTRGLRHLQRLAYDRFQAAMETFDAALRIWRSAKSEDPGAEPKKPMLRHYWTSNFTVEAVMDRAQQAHGLGLTLDELIGFVLSQDQYKSQKGADRPIYLSLYSGTDIKTDRQSRDSVILQYPVLGVTGGIQNDKVSSLHGKDAARDGFIERFLLDLPDVQPSDWTEDELPDYLGENLDRFFEAIDALPPMESRPVRVRLRPDAKRVWIAWYNDNVRIMRESQGIERGFASKWSLHCIRFALVLHAAWSISEGTDIALPVPRERIDDAIELVEWFRVHLHRVLPLLQITGGNGISSTGGQALRVERQLRKAAGAWVSRSDLLRALGNVPTDQLTEYLTAMKDAGVVESRVTRAPEARKSLEEWRFIDAQDVDSDRMVF